MSSSAAKGSPAIQAAIQASFSIQAAIEALKVHFALNPK
jgi:hypothetical protein